MALDRRTVEVAGGTVSYVDVGAGPALLLVAGIGANADLWAGVIAQLADRFRCVAVDLPLGAHRHPVPGSDRTPRGLAKMLLDVVDALGLDDVTLVGNDTGGGLCLVALDEPRAGERIGRLALTNCDSYEHFPPRSFAPLCRLAARAPRVVRALWRGALRTGVGRRRFARSVTARPVDPATLASFFDPLRDVAIADDAVAVMGNLRPEATLDAAPTIGRFDRPVLLAWGDRARFFPLSHAERLQRDFPDARLEVIRGAKTWVPLDEPERLAELLAGFVAATGS